MPQTLTIEQAEMYQKEISRRARLLMLRLSKMEFSDSPVPPEYDQGVTYAALFYAGIAVATQTLSCSTALEVAARFYRRIEKLTVEEVLASLEHDIVMEKPTKGVM